MMHQLKSKRPFLPFLLLVTVTAVSFLFTLLPPPEGASAQSAPAGVDATLPIDVVDALPGLSFNQPVDIANAGDERLFIVEQNGVIRVVHGRGPGATAQTFLDIRDRVLSGGEAGLLGLVFHPDYADNGYFYLNYTHQDGEQLVSRLSRFRVTADPDVADPNSELILLQLDQPFGNHNAGDLNFGPDGYLYVGFGDGGSGGDPDNRAQDPDDLLGKMLRIDVDNSGNGLLYAIPPDNPFVGGPGRDEIWAMGLRNPWRFSFDRATGDMYITDVGQNRWEEIDFQPAASPGGENYGWRLKEGPECFNPPSNCDPGGLTDPVWVYGREGGCSITGGFVYRGGEVPALQGLYVYSDFCSGFIWGLQQVAGSWTNAQLMTLNGNVSTFGEDAAGELFLAAYDTGTIYQFVQIGEPTNFVYVPLALR